MQNVDYATDYAVRGWRCFTVDGKRPLTKHGHLDATTDPGGLNRMWSIRPEAGVAIATGSRSGFFALDIDGEPGFETLRDLERRHGPLPGTPTVLTPGGGEHRYFEYCNPIGCSAGLVGFGLDIRGDGGYVVAPPSRHPNGGIYEWASEGHPDDIPVAPAPDWLEALTHQRAAQPAQASGDRIPEGQRNRKLFELACAMRHHGARRTSIGLALHNDNLERCDPPLPADEVEHIVASACRYDPADRREVVFTARVRL